MRIAQGVVDAEHVGRFDADPFAVLIADAQASIDDDFLDHLVLLDDTGRFDQLAKLLR